MVDDDPQAAALLEPALHDAPFEVQLETAPNYTAGLHRIQANEHDVYLVDYHLPDGTGTGLIHEARASGIEKPFILITGNGNGRVDEVALTEGAADYIEKDQLEKYLSRSIRYALRDWEYTQTLKSLYQEVLETSVRDALTGCFNRKHAIEVFERELHRSSRLNMPGSVVMFDIDRFKQINDQYGHLCGDAALASVGDRLRAALRSSDLMARYGGDEFLLLLPDTPPDGARHAIATLRHEFEMHPVVCQNDRIPIKASFGITAVRSGELDVTAIIARADMALYRAKHEGRDRVEVE